jgi:hypothetical protein
MNRLSLLQEIEVKSGSSGEESGAYDYRRLPTDTTARSDDDDDNDDSAGYDDDVDVDGEQNQEVVERPAERGGGKGKERDEEPREEGEETGEGEGEAPDEVEALDSPAIQEEAAQTYEGSRERNANMEKFYCLLLVEWGESMLNQARPHHPPTSISTFTHHCVLCVCVCVSCVVCVCVCACVFVLSTNRHQHCRSCVIGHRAGQVGTR